MSRLAASLSLTFTFLSLISATTQIALPGSESYKQCKPHPHGQGWPKTAQWSSLNHTVGGRLLAPLPPAVVCDHDRPQYNEESCNLLASTWFQSNFHASDPISVDWPNWQGDGCLPSIFGNASIKCDTKPFPAYVVAAEKKEDVAAAVKFAARTGVRLVVKGTGHDFLGRSTAPGALSIWTHKLQGMTVHESFSSSSCTKVKGIPAMTISAGHRMREIYAEAAKHNVITIGGMDPNVGFGGYLTGGGHSPISGKYGLAVDQVLEMEVVTPSGEIVTANECQNSDLFWAMRGGGGSTFGVLLTATVKTVPMPNITRFILNYNATQEEADNNNNDNFYRATAYFHTQLKALSQVPYMGYYYVLPLSEAGAAASSSNLTPRSLAPRSSTSKSGPMLFVWTGWGIDVSVEDTYKAFAPTVAKLDSTEGVNSVFVAFPGGDFYSYWASSISDGGVGVNAQLTSRLWDEAALSDEELLYQTLHKLDDQMLQGLAVSGPGVRSIAPDFSSVTPAWRKSYAHMIVPKSYPMRDPAAKAATEKTLTYDIGKTLRDQGGSGCYLNEADVNEPDYEHAFWGSNYKRLAKIKRKLDPKGVFWCKACVGGKEWKEAADGTVCRA